jgi:transporter family-2 protein
MNALYSGIWILFALMIGLLIPFQGILTAHLSKNLGHPFGSAFINFCGGTIIFIIAIALSKTPLPPLKKVTSIPWYLFTGGLVGSFFILGALFLLPKLGATLFFGQVVLGQLLMTIILDHFGILGLPVHKIDFFRIVGIIFLIIGSSLILKK